MSQCTANTSLGRQCKKMASRNDGKCHIHSAEQDGFVYVLENESLDGLVKIGTTTRTAEERAKELSTTGIPTPFVVAHQTERIKNAAATEKRVHQQLHSKRVTNGREFFRCSTQEAVDAINSAVTADSIREEVALPTVPVRSHIVTVPAGVDEIVIRFERATLDEDSTEID